MRLINIIISCLVASYFVAACQNPNQNKKTIHPDIDLAGQLYIVLPEIDPIKCVGISECDCCISHYLFLNTTDFIGIIYCLESDTYFKGNYNYKNSTIFFSADGRFVDKVYPMDDENNSPDMSPGQFEIKTNHGKSSKFKWMRFECNHSVAFTTDGANPEIAIEDPDMKLGELIDKIKEEGIWTSLEMK